MRDEDGLDPPPARIDPRQQRPRGDVADRTRSPIEQDERIAGLDRDRRTVADREHRALEVRRMHGRVVRASTAHEQRKHGRPRDATHAPPHRTERDDARDGGQRTDGPVVSAKRDRTRSATNRDLDKLDLQPRRQPHRPREDREKRRPDRADQRLRIRDRERHRRERRTEEREKGSVRLERAEVHQDDRRAGDEGRKSGCQHARQELARHADPCGESAARIVARHPREPAPCDRHRQMPQREHAPEAQLESRIERIGWRGDEHQHRGGRKHGIAMPLPPKRAARCADDRHQGRAHGACRGCHQHKRPERRDTARDRMHAFARRDHARRKSDDPSKHREVEARDREDVREPDRAERVLDHAVPVLRVTKDKRHEHRPDRDPVVVRHTLEQRRAHTNPCRLAKPRERIRERRLHDRIGDHAYKSRRVDGDGSDDTAPCRELLHPRIARKPRRIDVADGPDERDSVRDAACGRRVEHRDREQRIRVAEGVTLPRFIDEGHIRDQAHELRRTNEMLRQQVDGEPTLHERRRDLRLDAREPSFVRQVQPRSSRRCRGLLEAKPRAEHERTCEDEARADGADRP